MHDEDEIKKGEGQQDRLTTLDGLAYESSEVGTIVPESMILQRLLEVLPGTYRLEKCMLRGESLKRETLVTRTLARDQPYQESQTISGETLVVEEIKSKRSKESSGGKSRCKSKIVCFQWDRPVHVQSKCTMKLTYPVFGGSGHTKEQCDTDNKALAVSDSKCSRDDVESDSAEMMTVLRTSGDISNVDAKVSQGMTGVDVFLVTPQRNGIWYNVSTMRYWRMTMVLTMLIGRDGDYLNKRAVG